VSSLLQERSMKKGQIDVAEAYVLSKITARKRSGRATNRVRETNAKLVMRMDSMRIWKPSQMCQWQRVQQCGSITVGEDSCLSSVRPYIFW